MFFSPDQGPEDDALRVYAFVSQYYRDLGIEFVDVNVPALTTLVRAIHRNFPYPGGEEGASAFKKAAQFVCYFAAYKPVATLLPSEIIARTEGDDGTARTNAALALVIAIESLKDATLTWNDGSEHVLLNRIELSRHSFVDITDALTNITPVTAFKLVSVLLEQMAYKTNPDCQYPIPSA